MNTAPLYLTCPRVLILYDARPVLDVAGHESPVDPFTEPPKVGNVVVGKFRLPHGVTDRVVEVTDQGYVGVDGQLVTEELVSYRWPDSTDLAEWVEYKRERLADCSEETNVRSPWNWNVPWARPAAKCGGMSS